MVVKTQQAPQLPWFLMLLDFDLQFGGAPTLKLDWTDGMDELGVPLPWGFLAPRSSKRINLKITYVFLIKEISKLIDRKSGGRWLSIEIVNILKRPAELGKLSLIQLRSKILNFAKISSILVIALGGASIVGRGNGQ